MGNVIVLTGPTASGKTKLSVELAKQINGEIVSADSMQVYKYMNIGTAKPDIQEMSGIRHYLIDEVSPDEEFSVARYQKLALKYINDIIKNNKTPIVVGGTGLYINSLIYNLDFSETVSDWDLRNKLKKQAEEMGNNFLHNKLKEIDPEAAARIHINDTKRVIRAIEVYKHTKKTISYHQKISKKNSPLHRFLVLGLRMNREELYERINKRVDNMLEDGLINEVKRLIDAGFNNNTVAMQGLGYKEFLYYFSGLLTLEEATSLLKRNTRRYAKRQMTWFRKIESINWIDVNENDSIQNILGKVQYHVATSGTIL